MIKKIISIFLVFCAFGTFFVAESALATDDQLKSVYYTGKVISIQDDIESSKADDYNDEELLSAAANNHFQKIKIKIIGTNRAGDEVEIKWSKSNNPRDPILKEGQKLVISCAQIENEEICNMAGFSRTGPIVFLLILFALIAVIIAGVKGLKAIITLLLSLGVIVLVIVPLILKGFSPFYLAMIGGSLILIPSVYLIHGFRLRSHIALGSIFVTIILVTVLGMVFAQWFHLTGFSGEEAMYINENINLYAIMIGGLILATLGVVDDVVITQISIVKELHDSSPELSSSKLFLKSLKIGRDHIYTIINTLFLVYAGTSLPILILANQNNTPFPIALQNESITTEILRTITGTIGLMLAMPLSAYIASIVIKKKPNLF